MMTRADYKFAIKHLSVLEEIPTDHLRGWMQRMTRVRYAEGAKIQCGVDAGIGLILVKSGALRIFLLSREGRELTLYNIQAGEACVISTKLARQVVTFQAHIEAETDCVALRMNADAFAGLCEAHPCAEIFFSRLLSKRLSLSVEALERAFSLSLDQRLAAFLIDGVAMGEGNDIVLTHDQIARHIGSTREVVTRTLGHFADWGVVKLTRGNVEVVNQKKLDRLAR